MTSPIAYIKEPQEFMREHPMETSPVVSDAIYSEEIQVVEEAGEWTKIETLVDGYRGWVRKKAIISHPKDFFGGPLGTIAKIHRNKAHLYSIKDTEKGPILSLPFGSRLKILEELEEKRWIKVSLLDGREAFIQRGDVTKEFMPLSRREIVEFSKNFLDLPYTWGGRSSFGFDCSGFTQMLYREMGISIPRDSQAQFAWEGFVPVPVDLQQLKAGDLIFFGLAKNKIRHVGMYIGREKFIHSTVREFKPWIRISSLHDEEWRGKGTLPFRGACTLRREDEGKKSLRTPLFVATVALVAFLAHRFLAS